MKDKALFFILALLAEIGGTIGGFGSSVLFVPLANYFLDFHSVLGITALFHVSSNISKIALFKKGFDKQLILHIGVPAVLFVILGAFLTQYCNTRLLEFILSIFLILLSATLIIVKNLVVQPTLRNSIIGGSASGFLAGLIGTGGSVRGITLAAFNLEKEKFIATSAIIDLGVDSTRAIIYSINGYVHKSDFPIILGLFVIGLIGTFIGKQILKKIPQLYFRKIVLVLILVAGIGSLLKYFGVF